MNKLLLIILSISLITMMIFPNSGYAMENSQIMNCGKEMGKAHKNCCSKKENKSHSSKEKDSNKSCDKKNSACLCIGVVATVALKTTEVESTQNVFVLLSKNYSLIDDKKPSLVYLDKWLLPKI